MAQETARPDVDEAKQLMGASFGAGRELDKLPEVLTADEHVEALVAGDHGPGSGLLVLTDRRVFFMFEGLVRKDFADFPLAEVTSVDWKTGLNLGTLTMFAGGTVAIKGIDKDGGEVFLRRLRELTGA